MLERLHEPRWALLTDLYQLTMAFAYWKSGMAEQEAVFHLYFRRNPFRGRFAVACGLGYVLDILQHWGFSSDDLNYLRSLRGADDQPLFAPGFLEYLRQLELRCDIEAVPEGTVVFPPEPLLRVRGPLLQAQLLETVLLNSINFQTLIATKAVRVRRAAGTDEVLEFGLRRAQGPDGGLSASRAAFIGGCDGTSNLLAGEMYDIPVKGTHAHSWVVAFSEEQDAFETYARALPNNCLLLVDTYDTLNGVRRAIVTAQRLEKTGHRFLGVRLDSGDIAELSRATRQLLDDAGLPHAKIVASGDLDEHRIVELKRRGARVDIWGVGTRLVTGHEDGALGGVYKLSAIRTAPEEAWQRRMKTSNDPAKGSHPGILQVRRYLQGNQFAGDVIYDQEYGIDTDGTSMPAPGQRFSQPPATSAHDLLVPVFVGGRCVDRTPPLRELQAHVRAQIAQLPDWVQSDVDEASDATSYPVSFETHLYEEKLRLNVHPR